MNNKKILNIKFFVLLLLVVLSIGFTYAFFSYNRTSNRESVLVMGDIYMHYIENNHLNITDAIPRDTFIENKYFEFTIEGVNDSSNDIHYEILLNHGNDHPTKTERIKDNFISFRLVEVVNNVEQELFTGRSYNNLINKSIWTDVISKETNEEISKVYRLYMWINNDVLIGVGDNIDYTMDIWNNLVYASIKVSVNGSFEPKLMATPEEAFTINTFKDENNEVVASIVDYDTSYGTEVVIPEYINGKKVVAIGDYTENPLTFTNNSKTKGKIQFLGGEPADLPAIVYNGVFYESPIEVLHIPDSVKIIDKAAFALNKLKKVYIGSGIEYIDESAFFMDSQCNAGACNSDLESITIDKTCDEIKLIKGNPNDAESYMPWTSAWWYQTFDWPYVNKINIYGSNNEYCGKF